jgi:hypothetical protein
MLSDDMDLLGDYEEEEYYDRLISFFDDDEQEENDSGDDEDVQLVEEDNVQTVEAEDDDTDWQLTPGESDASLNFYDDDDVQSVEDDSPSGFTVNPSSPSLVAGITSKIDVEGVEDSVNDVTASQSAVTRKKLVSDQTSVQTVTNNLPL